MNSSFEWYSEHDKKKKKKSQLMSILLLVAYWLKYWTVGRKVSGSSPTCSRDFFLFFGCMQPYLRN